MRTIVKIFFMLCLTFLDYKSNNPVQYIAGITLWLLITTKYIQQTTRNDKRVIKRVLSN